MKKIFCALLTLVMLITLLPISALAADQPQLVMCWREWADGKFVPSQGYFVESRIQPLSQETVFPALLIDGKLTMLDPADVYAADSSALSVHVSESTEGAISFRVYTLEGTQILYDHTDGNTYAYWVYGQLPELAFYSAPEATLEHHITSFTASNDKDTIYLISQSDITLEDLRLENFPAGTAYTLSTDKKTAAITIGHAAVQNVYASTKLTRIDEDGSRWEISGPGLSLSTDFSGLFFRRGTWDTGLPTENRNYDRENSFQASNGETFTLFFHFFDGSKETRLTADQLRVENEGIVRLSNYGDGTEAVNVMATGFGKTAIVYEVNGVSHRLPVHIELPTFGFYTAPVISTETYISNIFHRTDDSNTVYLMIGDALPTYRISDPKFNVADSMHIQDGSFKLSEDGRCLAITIGEMPAVGMYCAVEFTLTDAISGESLRRTEILTVENSPAPSENPFTDVSENDWFYAPVLWAVKNSITGGLTPTTFGPNASCTRAQVVTFLYAAAGKPEVNPTANPFTDVSESDWFYKPVMWAVENGITGGLTPDTFGPNNTCTRAQVVTFLYAAAGKPTPNSTDHPFTDVNSGDWYLNPVLWAVEKGVTGGKTANTFAPNETCTRAQVVTFLYAYKTK